MRRRIKPTYPRARMHYGRQWRKLLEGGTQTLTLGDGRRHGGTGRLHVVAFVGPAASGVFWSLPDPIAGVVASQISFMFILHLNPSFQLF